MRILYLGNNWLGWKVLEWLTEQDEEVVGLVTHPPGRSKHDAAMRGAVGLPENRVFDGAALQEPEVLQMIEELEPDIGVSVLFGYILKPAFLDLFPKGCVNLHPAYLPYNRGAYPNVWSIIEGTPAGATLHRIDEGIDTGSILARRRVEVRPTDTGRSLYEKLEQTALELFCDSWPKLEDESLDPIEQEEDEGTMHYVKDVEEIDCIDLDAIYTARELIDILRARTYPPHPGAYFKHEGRKVYLRLELFEE